MSDFVGVKAALLINNKVVVIQRDNKPGLRFAGMWDFPGGGREYNETPMECIVRELNEELGLTLKPGQIVWEKEWPALHDARLRAWFMVAKLDSDAISNVQLHEGQRWKIMPIANFLDDPLAIGGMKERLRDYLDAQAR